MKLAVKALCDVGLKRKNNEDMILLANELIRDEKSDRLLEFDPLETACFLAVADGMGGHHAGEVASEMVLGGMFEKLAEMGKGLDDADLKSYVRQSAKEVHFGLVQAGENDEAKQGMGSTLIALLFYEARTFFINVGDSRCYLLRNQQLTQLSRDHSLRELTGNPELPGNIIVSSFGGGQNMVLDFKPIPDGLQIGDQLLLCSDGLSDLVSHEEIQRLLLESTEPMQDLLQAAYQGGGKDNVSIVLTHVLEGPEPSYVPIDIAV